MNGSNTIEPRLIALLNDASSEFASSPSLELPPLHDPNILKASGRPLLLEPDARHRNEKRASSSQLNSNHTSLLPPIDDEETTYKPDERKQTTESAVREWALGGSSPQSLRKILRDNAASSPLVPTKKRHQVEPNKDDFVQLPQPPKKQKTAKQVVPPIIIGLFEPPPQATLFPPIASSSFHDSHGRNSLNPSPLKAIGVKDTTKDIQGSNRDKIAVADEGAQQRKGVATRKKWSEEETNNLLLGVHRHGVGCWTDILADSSFVFNRRSPSDLKDRWRTCCPDEWRKTKRKASAQKCSKDSQAQPKSSLMTENILLEDDHPTCSNALTSTRTKKRGHRKRLEDLVQLGIQGPVRQSIRRERRQFSSEEDRAILEGYNVYGPQWSKIQKDPQLKLQSRQPTDLRDRFRNRYPDKFREDKGAKASAFRQSTESKAKETQFPYSQQEQEIRLTEAASRDAHTAGPQLSLHSLPCREGLRIQEMVSSESFHNFVDQSSIDAADNMPYSQFPDWNQVTAAPFSGSIGEMDIARLLLDETWSYMPNGKEKQSLNDTNHMLSSSSEPLSNIPSFFNVLNDPDDMNDGTF